MSHLRVIICEVDEENNNEMTELANVEVYDGPEATPRVKTPTAGHQVVHSLSKLASVFYGKNYKRGMEAVHSS